MIPLAAMVALLGSFPDDPVVIKLDIPAPKDTAGGIIVADVDDDGRLDYLVTVPGHVAAYGNDGARLWVRNADVQVTVQSERNGLPGHHGPGVAAGDVDGDGKTEVLIISRDSVIHILEGATGKTEATAKPPVPEGAARWEMANLADFRGHGGDRDVLLQATNAKGYRTGKFLAAYSADALVGGGKPLWTTDRFVGCAHNGARLADLDGDGKDEVLGAQILGPDGTKIAQADEFQGHMDSVFVADVDPDKPGFEIVLLEEGSNYVQVVGLGGVAWRNHFRKQEPQNAAIGRFRRGSDEIFIWCRSRYARHQKPFVFDSKGTKILDYAMDDVAPEGWTDSGVEVIHTIDWTGGPVQLACAKERHKEGDVGLYEPLTGEFVARFAEHADRLYVADVLGDWREEIIVLNRNELHVYRNPEPNPRPDRPRLWSNRNYRRLKQVHNYYSP